MCKISFSSSFSALIKRSWAADTVRLRGIPKKSPKVTNIFPYDSDIYGQSAERIGGNETERGVSSKKEVPFDTSVLRLGI